MTWPWTLKRARAHTHTRAGSRGIKSHCVRSRSTERGIKDLRDVIWLIWGVSAGLRGDWRYSRGWLTLLICITHQTGSRQRGSGHTWGLDAKDSDGIHTGRHEEKKQKTKNKRNDKFLGISEKIRFLDDRDGGNPLTPCRQNCSSQ